MSKNTSQNSNSAKRGRQRQIRIRSQLRREPDFGRIARTVVAVAIAQAEKEAQAENAHRTEPGEVDHD